jgi:opacity protein-like surface antigen
MNKSFFAVAAAAFLFASAAQAAQTDETATNPSVQISSGKTHFKMYPSDFETYAGSYALDNGDVIKLKQVRGHYFTEVYGQDPVEVVALGAGVFAAKDGTTLTFRDNGNTFVLNGPDQRHIASR